jgi:membrane-associated phospholipid phosphatase
MLKNDTWCVFNITDRLLIGYWSGLSIAILARLDRVDAWPWFLLLHLLFIVMVVVLARHREVWPIAHAWYPLLVPLVAFQETALLHDLLRDGWQDRFILALESQLFEVPPTVSLQQYRRQAFSEMLQFGYLSYFLFLPFLGWVLYRRADRRPFFDLMAATTLANLACYVVFLLFPTEGPAHTLRDLHTQPIPDGPLASLVQFLQRAGTHGNAFPSAHVAGAVVPAIFAARYAIRYAPLLFASLVLMCVGAVYDRYHYASDIAGGLVIGGTAAVLFLRKTEGRSPAYPGSVTREEIAGEP